MINTVYWDVTPCSLVHHYILAEGNVNDNIGYINDTPANSNTETCFVTTVGLEVGDRKKLISQ